MNRGALEVQSSDQQPAKIFDKAQIYRVTFNVGDKKYVYVGLDTNCNPNYYGSSLVIFHYQKIFGTSLFEPKEILEELTDLTMSEICQIERKYIRQTKLLVSKDKAMHSINYTGQNRRDSGPKINISLVGKQVVAEAKQIGLKLDFIDEKHGVIKPTNPPSPFGRLSRGMHIETYSGLKQIGFSFLTHRSSESNICVAWAILMRLGFADSSISETGSKKDYIRIMATHNLQEPMQIAELYKNLVTLAQDQSKLFSNEPADVNKNLPEKYLLEKAAVEIERGRFLIKRYEGNFIRIYKEGSKSAMPNTKAVLVDINLAYDLNIEQKDWAQTQRAGKAILRKLKSLKLGERL